MSGPGAPGMQTKSKENKDEEEIQQALKQLKLLHIKCRELRTTIPPEEVFQSFMRSVHAAHSEIKDFGDLYNSEESKKALNQAKKSRETNPKDIKPWRAKDDPHWYDLDN
ncbi:hypothetical protein UCREL1_5741 [Eutypa lata UCREL1]|uniref:Uncharacterized protein n=1 Tax=Eutypa lata (strain UCR-EL1) TaxID=1287681 RepID=M7TBJ9_EUTLA|nr:hypothetical protein UCREL1_5741 [Eutypa lata UCREL1]